MRNIEKVVAEAIAAAVFNPRWAPTAKSCYVQDQGLRQATIECRNFGVEQYAESAWQDVVARHFGGGRFVAIRDDSKHQDSVGACTGAAITSRY